MTTTSKNVFALAAYGLCAAALGAAVTLYAGTQPGDESDQDRADLHKIRSAYVAALNSGNAAPLMEYLDPNVEAVMATGETIKSAAEFKAYLEKMSDLIGLERGGSYQIESVDTARRGFFKDMAYAHGSTTESVQSVDKQGKKGKFYRYDTEWESWLRKDSEGKWKLVSGKVTVDPRGRTFDAMTLAKIKALANSYKKKT